MSKAGIQTLFGSKVALQLDTIDFASEILHAFVVAPAEPVPAGLARLQTLLDRWTE